MLPVWLTIELALIPVILASITGIIWSAKLGGRVRTTGESRTHGWCTGDWIDETLP